MRARAGGRGSHRGRAGRGPDLAGARLKLGVQYEPIVEVRTGATCAHEALARFRTPEGAPLDTATVFAELHRRPALLAELEFELKVLQLEHAPAGPLFVNVDPDAFAGCTARGLPLLDVLGQRGPHRVVVEVIENVRRTDAGFIRTLIRDLEIAGLGVALDDLGSPNALVSFESFLSVQYLKLDHSTVRGCANPKRRALVEGLVALARRLGIHPVLEGVEAREDVVLAETLGIELVQGWLFRERFRSVEAAPRSGARRRHAAAPG
jgi:EAL domain-containing protein (putative c-di-GMP-specific phosphodiesterase class I)